MISPLLRSPTADPNTTVGLALLVVLIFLTCAGKTEGIWNYIKGLGSPSIFLFPINLIGEFAKPINTSMRLFGNMFAGIIIMGLIYSLSINIFGHVFSFAAGWPAFLHVYFDLFTGTGKNELKIQPGQTGQCPRASLRRWRWPRRPQEL